MLVHQLYVSCNVVRYRAVAGSGLACFRRSLARTLQCGRHRRRPPCLLKVSVKRSDARWIHCGLRIPAG